MSKIHEALKKAEQERATGSSSELSSPAPVPTSVRETALSALNPTIGVPDSLAPGPIVAEEPITLEALAARCPRHRWNPDPKSLLFVNSHNHVHGTEEFRTLRSRLYQLRDKQPLRTLLIASVMPEEGKTFTTANLAQAIVRQHERRALVIDGDLRRAQLHNSFGAPLSPGLTEYLLGEADEFSVIQRGPTDNLFLIAGGKSISNPVELLSNGRLKNLLERVGPVFDWILFDSPPAVAVSDASLLADMCDGVLLVVQAGRTPFDVAQKAREEFHDKSLVGVVLNRVEPGETYQSYYYSYYKSAPGKLKSKG
jgi:capsular exopolysaccharide synthesis family protein